MGRIDTPDELREYLDEFDILLPLTAEEAEKVLEYIKNSGYTLETDGYGQLYRTDLENGECLETDIDHMIDDACESNYEMISDIRDYFVFCGGKERDNLFQVLQHAIALFQQAGVTEGDGVQLAGREVVVVHHLFEVRHIDVGHIAYHQDDFTHLAGVLYQVVHRL